MATYYIGADVHSNNTQLAIEQRGKIMARYSVPTTIPAISTVLSSVQGRKILAISWNSHTMNRICSNESCGLIASSMVLPVDQVTNMLTSILGYCFLSTKV